jgi:hypothetical protein
MEEGRNQRGWEELAESWDEGGVEQAEREE